MLAQLRRVRSHTQRCVNHYVVIIDFEGSKVYGLPTNKKFLVTVHKFRNFCALTKHAVRWVYLGGQILLVPIVQQFDSSIIWHTLDQNKVLPPHLVSLFLCHKTIIFLGGVAIFSGGVANFSGGDHVKNKIIYLNL